MQFFDATKNILNNVNDRSKVKHGLVAIKVYTPMRVVSVDAGRFRFGRPVLWALEGITPFLRSSSSRISSEAVTSFFDMARRASGGCGTNRVSFAFEEPLPFSVSLNKSVFDFSNRIYFQSQLQVVTKKIPIS
jgi:hypothetical protein